MTGEQYAFAATGLVALTIVGQVLSGWLHLRFYRHVYDRGGAKDVVIIMLSEPEQWPGAGGSLRRPQESRQRGAVRRSGNG